MTITSKVFHSETPRTVVFQALCNEPEGARVRTARIMNQSWEHVLEIYEKLQRVPNFLDGPDPIATLLNPKVMFLEVDDIGLLAAFPEDDGRTHCHMTFWDQRLRGREELCRIALRFLRAIVKGVIYTGVPESARVIVAFAKRCGFEETAHQNGVVMLIYNPRSV